MSSYAYLDHIDPIEKCNGLTVWRFSIEDLMKDIIHRINVSEVSPTNIKKLFPDESYMLPKSRFVSSSEMILSMIKRAGYISFCGESEDDYVEGETGLLNFHILYYIPEDISVGKFIDLVNGDMLWIEEVLIFKKKKGTKRKFKNMITQIPITSNPRLNNG